MGFQAAHESAFICLRSVLLAAVAITASLPLCNSAHATSLRYFTLKELLEISELVVEADVKSVETVGADPSSVSTLVTIKNLQPIRGNCEVTELQLIQLGGEVDGQFLEVEGSPKLAVDEHVVLFIYGNNRLVVPILGWTQGVFRLDRAGNATDYDGNAISEIDSGGNLIKTDSAASAAETEKSEETVGHVHKRADETTGLESDAAPNPAEIKSPMSFVKFVEKLRSLSLQMPPPARTVRSYDATSWSSVLNAKLASPPPSSTQGVR